MNTTYSGTTWVGAGNELNIVEARDADGNIIQGFTNVEGNYDVMLPNFDFDIEPWENIVLRASFSETITRPNYNDIKGGLSPNGTQFLPNTRPQASAGNPDLVPIQSQNIDFSVEWYYAPGSYVSVGYFDKKVENFIGVGRTSGTPFEIPNIVGGALWNRAIAESGIDPDNYTPWAGTSSTITRPTRPWMVKPSAAWRVIRPSSSTCRSPSTRRRQTSTAGN